MAQTTTTPPVTASAVADSAPARINKPRRGRRSVGASIALHGTLIVASLIAIGPIAWVVLSSFKPGYAVQSTEITLVKDPTLANYQYVLFETNFPTWFLNSVIVAALTMVIGIFLSATTGNLVRDNTVNGNQDVGIAVSGLSSGNTLRGNTAYGNGLYDLTDDNPPGNTWLANLYFTSNF